MFTLERDERPPHNGWAGGNYECQCLGCSKSFLGDKRCLTCADCAYAPDPASTGKSDLLCADDYAYKSIDEYEEITGIKVNDAFRIGWDMARATMTQLTNLNPLTRSENE